MFTDEKSIDLQMSHSNPQALESVPLILEPVPFSNLSATSQVNFHLTACCLPMVKSQELMKEAEGSFRQLMGLPWRWHSNHWLGP